MNKLKAEHTGEDAPERSSGEATAKSATEKPKPLHVVVMDLMEAVPIVVAGTLASAVTYRLVLLAAIRQATVDSKLVGQNPSGHDLLLDHRLSRFLTPRNGW